MKASPLSLVALGNQGGGFPERADTRGVSSHFSRGFIMESKLTPELSKALDRAIDAAGTDPLVEALEACELARVALVSRAVDHEGKAQLYRAGAAVRALEAVLAKYRPVSESDTNS